MGMMHMLARTADDWGAPALAASAVDPLELGLAWGAVIVLALGHGLAGLVRAGRR